MESLVLLVYLGTSINPHQRFITALTRIHTIRRLTIISLALGNLMIVVMMYFFSYWIRSKSAFFFFQEPMPSDRFLWVTHHFGLLIVLHFAFLYFHGLFDLRTQQTNIQIVSNVVRAVTLEILVLVSVYFFTLDIRFPRSIFVLLWILISLMTSLWHILFNKIYHGRMPQRNLLIVGTNENTRELLKEIKRLPAYRLSVVGVLSEDPETVQKGEFMGYPILGSRDSILEIVKKHSIHEVVISSEGSWQDALIDQISKVDQISTRISVIPTCYEILIGKIDHLRLYDIPLIEVIKHPQAPVGKRFFDIAFSIFLMIITSPLFIFTMLLIRLASGKPVFFKQTRIGKDRIPFTIIKFRTLKQDAERETGPTFTNFDDPRLTKIGKFIRKYRIDELPQLINILKGEMSFVGPRPERPYFINQYIDKIPGYGERFKAKPGLTGLAQVNGGYDTSPANKLKYDLTYIYNQSLWLDFRILLETVKVILTGRVNP